MKFIGNSFSTFNISVLFIITIISISGCSKDKDLCTPSFNVNTFEQNINDAFGNNVMGYAYVIANAGTVVRSGAIGKAQSAIDGNINMSLDLDMQVASISKFITSILAIKVCRDNDVPLTTPIGPYLPLRWTRGTGIDNVTIAELISHTSGLTAPGTQAFNATLFNSLQTVVNAGATLPKTRNYTNTNAGLLRIILPVLQGVASASTITDVSSASFYREMVRDFLFDEIGITGDLIPINTNQILAYTGANDETAGSGSTTDFTLVSGGIGWNLSCTEVAKFWAYAWFTNDFIDDADKQYVKDNRAGVWNTILGGQYGNYYSKLGGWNFTGGTPSQSMNSAVMLFPNNYQITIFTNSPVPGGVSLATLAMNAYDNAFNCN